MNTIRTSNIPLRTFRDFLISMGCKKVNNGTKGRGGHEKWVKEGALRPITLQTHIDPVPLQVVKSNLNNLGLTKKDLEQWLLNHK